MSEIAEDDDFNPCGFEYEHDLYVPDNRYPDYSTCRTCGAEFWSEDDDA